MSQRVTIQDIADALGLSRNTVSKAINNADGLADATRQRIIQKAAEMGYKQFALINALPMQQPESQQPAFLATQPDRREVALLSTAYLAAPHFSSLMLDAFQNQISQLGLTLNTHRVTPVNLEDHSLPATLDLGRVAAIICIEMFDHSYDQMVCGLGIPILFVDGPANTRGLTLPADQLYMENTTQVMRLTSSVVAAGRTRIGFIGNWQHCQSFYERYCAFRLAMVEAGVAVSDRWLIQGNYEGDIVERLACLRDDHDLPDLFLCANDFVALDTLQALHSLGLRVPDDVALAGFDDSAESRRCMPRLTTIHIHTQIMAYEAVRLLRSRIEEPSLDYRRVYTETELIVRESTPFLA